MDDQKWLHKYVNSSMKKSDLLVILRSIPERFLPSGFNPGAYNSKANIMNAITSAQRESRKAPKKTAMQRGLTATEVNEMLATFPPLSLGDISA